MTVDYIFTEKLQKKSKILLIIYDLLKCSHKILLYMIHLLLYIILYILSQIFYLYLKVM